MAKQFWIKLAGALFVILFGGILVCVSCFRALNAQSHDALPAAQLEPREANNCVYINDSTIGTPELVQTPDGDILAAPFSVSLRPGQEIAVEFNGNLKNESFNLHVFEEPWRLDGHFQDGPCEKAKHAGYENMIRLRVKSHPTMKESRLQFVVGDRTYAGEVVIDGKNN